MRVQAVHVIGAGLAGCEAAWQLAVRGVPVILHEMKPHKRSPAHHRDTFAELVCSNSLRGDSLTNAVGLLKEEMRRLGSLILLVAEHCRLPAGGALAVDREGFSSCITHMITKNPLITVVREEVMHLPDEPAIIATGPLTAEGLAAEIAAFVGKESLHFFDAAAPIVTRDSLDMNIVFAASRYGKGEDDYLNCPMNEEEYMAFWQALRTAEVAPMHGFENDKVFEGCLPVEVMAQRGQDTLRYGPLKPVGLVGPKDGREPYAVVQLRRDDAQGELYNIVGFQTHLKFPEQKRVFSMIPGLAHAEFARFGVMHRNTFLDAPALLDETFAVKTRPMLYFAGQITGVEGYVESAASGFMAGIHMARKVLEKTPVQFSKETALGALAHYIATPNRHFQPMNVSFGLLPPMPNKIKGGKRARYEALSVRALVSVEKLLIDMNA